MSINRWMDKEDVVYLSLSLTHPHTHTQSNEYYSVIKNNEKLPFAATWVDLEGIMPGKVSQINNDKYCIISHIYGI